MSRPIEGGLTLTHMPHQQRGKASPFKAADHRLKPPATEPTNEALSIVAGQQREREERERDVTLSSAKHDSALCPFSSVVVFGWWWWWGVLGLVLYPLPEQQKQPNWSSCRAGKVQLLALHFSCKDSSCDVFCAMFAGFGCSSGLSVSLGMPMKTFMMVCTFSTQLQRRQEGWHCITAPVTEAERCFSDTQLNIYWVREQRP